MPPTTDTPTRAELDRADDPTLVARALAGDDDAFEHLYRRHVRAVRGYCTLRVGPGAAEDVVVDTFVAAWQCLGRFDPTHASARPWLYGIATRVLSRHRDTERRWNRSRRAGEQATTTVGAAPDVPHEPDPDLVRALSRIHPRERDVLLLVALGELSLVETASILGISHGAARLRMFRARRALGHDLGGTRHA